MFPYARAGQVSNNGGGLGVKSQARALVSPSGRGEPKPTGFAVYRATVDVEKMRAFPELAWILEKHNLNLWYCTPILGPPECKLRLTISGSGRIVML